MAKKREYPEKYELLKASLKIDKFKLDKDAAEQSDLMEEICQEAAYANYRVVELEDEVKLCFAELDHAVRDRPSVFGLDDPKEAAIKAAVLQQEQYKSLRTRLHQAKLAAELWDGIKTAAQHRKNMIETEFGLWSQGYYAMPRVSSEVREKIQNDEKREARDMNRRRRE